MLGDPGEEGLAVVPLGFAEVAGSDWTWRANLWTGWRGTISSPSSRKEEAETRGSCCAHLAATAAPVQAATAGTGQGTGADGLALKRAAGAATAAGCPAASRVTNFSVNTMDSGNGNLVQVKVLLQLLHSVSVVKCAEGNSLLWHVWPEHHLNGTTPTTVGELFSYKCLFRTFKHKTNERVRRRKQKL